MDLSWLRWPLLDILHLVGQTWEKEPKQRQMKVTQTPVQSDSCLGGLARRRLWGWQGAHTATHATWLRRVASRFRFLLRGFSWFCFSGDFLKSLWAFLRAFWWLFFLESGKANPSFVFMSGMRCFHLPVKSRLFGWKDMRSLGGLCLQNMCRHWVAKEGCICNLQSGWYWFLPGRNSRIFGFWPSKPIPYHSEDTGSISLWDRLQY